MCDKEENIRCSDDGDDERVVLSEIGACGNNGLSRTFSIKSTMEKSIDDVSDTENKITSSCDNVLSRISSAKRTSEKSIDNVSNTTTSESMNMKATERSSLVKIATTPVVKTPEMDRSLKRSLNEKDETTPETEREVLSILLAHGSKTPARIGREMSKDRSEVRSVLKSLRKSGIADCVVGEEDEDENVWFLTTDYLNELLSRESSRATSSSVVLPEIFEDGDNDDDDDEVTVSVEMKEDEVENSVKIDYDDDDEEEKSEWVEVVVDSDDDDAQDNSLLPDIDNDIVEEDSISESSFVEIIRPKSTQRPRRKIITDTSSSEEDLETSSHALSPRIRKTKRTKIITDTSSDEEEEEKQEEDIEEEEFDLNMSTSRSSSPSLLQISNDLNTRTKSLGGFIVSDDDFSSSSPFSTTSTTTSSSTPQSTTHHHNQQQQQQQQPSSPWTVHGNYVKLSKTFQIHHKIFSQLYKHQIEGLEWMWKLWNRSSDAGGILADDMGLGKTVQVRLFLTLHVYTSRFENTHTHTHTHNRLQHFFLRYFPTHPSRNVLSLLYPLVSCHNGLRVRCCRYPLSLSLSLCLFPGHKK